MDKDGIPVDDAAVTPKPHQKLRRRLITANVAALVIGGFIVTMELTGPDEPVERFLDAALNRDVDDALAEVLPETVKRIQSADSPDLATDFDDADFFLNHEAMRTDWSCSSVSTDGGVVTADLTGFGKTETASFTVVDTDDGWKPLGSHGTRTTLEYRFTCEFAPEGIRGRLDSDDTFAMRSMPLDGEPMLISPDNKDCQYEHWVS